MNDPGEFVELAFKGVDPGRKQVDAVDQGVHNLVHGERLIFLQGIESRTRDAVIHRGVIHSCPQAKSACTSTVHFAHFPDP